MMHYMPIIPSSLVCTTESSVSRLRRGTVFFEIRAGCPGLQIMAQTSLFRPRCSSSKEGSVFQGKTPVIVVVWW